MKLLSPVILYRILLSHLFPMIIRVQGSKNVGVQASARCASVLSYLLDFFSLIGLWGLLPSTSNIAC